MKSWFQNLSRREQMIVALLSAVLGCLVFYAIAWAPLKGAVERYESSNAKAQEVVDWMRQATADIQRGRGGGAEDSAVQSISALVDSSLPKYKLVMQRYQPTGDDSAQLWLEDAALPQVIAWLVSIERDFGMRLVSVSVASSDKQGFVKARVRMAKP